MENLNEAKQLIINALRGVRTELAFDMLIQAIKIIDDAEFEINKKLTKA